MNNPEYDRLRENLKKAVPLETWGPYLSERQWGTVREDYSQNGDAWNYFPHDHARSRAYRWGEDGLAGISDLYQNLCFAVALWNGKDPILKERLFGLSNPEGNHGEDVKELYYYLDNIPSHYYMKYLYKYPQNEFPYTDLVVTNRNRSRQEPEYEILDTGIFSDNRYFDVYVEYAKNSSHDIFIKIEIVNRHVEAAGLTVLPTLWFYNRWQYSGEDPKPSIRFASDGSVTARHCYLGDYYLYFQNADEVLFTENETNFERLFNRPNAAPFVKDAFHDALINNKHYDRLRANRQGTKCAPVYRLQIEGRRSACIYLRLTSENTARPFADRFEQIFVQRRQEADAFYAAVIPRQCGDDQRAIMRQAFAGLLWNKQYYHYDVERWLRAGDGISPVTEQRKAGRNSAWKYLKNQDVMAMPDKWEYPWYAAWDTAFHCIALALIDPAYAKHQLLLLMREWYMNPQGQLPAYEWNFDDINPPVHAFAALQVYLAEQKVYGVGDVDFLKRIFQKLIINFTWWTNREDANDNNIFEGGFLGLDNIGLFNRSMTLPNHTFLEQADATSWMAMYALGMMDIALELARHDKSFEDAATKFYEHFVIIAEALNEKDLWCEPDRFFYDVLLLERSEIRPLQVRSIVGLTPLFAVSIIEPDIRRELPDFCKRMAWFQNYRRKNNLYLPSHRKDRDDTLLLSLGKTRLQALLTKMLDENEFLSPGGVRALSRYHAEHPYSLACDGAEYTIEYEPGDSLSGMFGGNSNWRGPVWMPMNFLVINALRVNGSFYGDDLKVDYPTGSGNLMNLSDIANELTRRLLSIFELDQNHHRTVHGPYNWFYEREENRALVLFYEYYHGDNSRGLGASHQTGWSALIVNLLYDTVNGPAAANGR